MKLTFSEDSKICDKQDQQLQFETETFALWSQILRLLAGYYYYYNNINRTTSLEVLYNSTSSTSLVQFILSKQLPS